MALGGVVLCGGESRRMGQSKAWLPFGPERMLQRVVRLTGDAAGPIVVVAAPGQNLPPLDDAITVVRDPVAGRGPLQGLAAGLAALPESVAVAYVTSTDAPFLQPSWIRRLHELLGSHDIAIPYVDGRHHPLAAVYSRGTVLAAAAELLHEGQFRLMLLTERTRTRVVGPGELRGVDPIFQTLRNLNTPADYQAALISAGFSTQMPLD